MEVLSAMADHVTMVAALAGLAVGLLIARLTV